ncbi:hypothetical protein CBR_g30289 [Chara braunii]|uniref:Reverse transcriptase domain-containing protein n=1 Tax=Chara braunii TaxID=69332 RepID=A0A388JX27_CHABU|nr:hypothetical protein CBR_g30289 [Chara braunii]|eukprot:GBG62335.1 hypothetical protein CBR_g30289 [Chara braunii]
MGICNVPTTFQRAMNVTFQNFVNKTRLTQGMINFCVIVYMDDILVYSETYHDHAQHIEWTLGALRDAGFKIALEKSEFFLSEISFLGYIVTRGGLRPDSRKVAVVKEALVPTSLTQWSACLEEPGCGRNPPSQRNYLNPWEIIDLSFFRDRTASEDEEIVIEQEEEESEEEAAEEGDKEETPEEGSYSEHNEGEQSEEEEEEEDELELEESEWEISAEEAEQPDIRAEDPEAARKREEIAAGKWQLEFARGANLQIADDPARDPEPPKPEDGEPAAETSTTPARQRRSRSPSPSTPDRPPVQARADAGHRASSPVVIPPSP